jgi:hypothetical protein
MHTLLEMAGPVSIDPEEVTVRCQGKPDLARAPEAGANKLR